MTNESDGLTGLVDLASQLEAFLGAAQLIGGEAAGNDEAVEIGRRDAVDVGVHGNGITALTGIGLLPHSRDRRARALFLEPNLGIPQLEVFVERRREKQDSFAFESHARNLYLCPP